MLQRFKMLLIVNNWLIFLVAESITRKQKEKEQVEDMTEEFEDASGNVFNRKTYNDLKRQGLLDT
jgi:hypothetical protein